VVAFVFADRIKSVARKLSPVRLNVVSARCLCVDPEGAASVRDDGKLARDAVDIFVRDEAEAEVAEVVEDRAAARKPARQKNAVCRHPFKIALGAGILIFAYNDGRGVLPEEKDLRSLSDIRRQELLRRKIAVRIM